MKIGIIGLGLIGGSLARSIHSHSEHTVLGWDLAPEIVASALSEGAIHEELPEGNPESCDVVLVALYPSLCVDYITAHAAQFAKDAVVIDCAGVKRSVCRPLFELAQDRDWYYVGGHPMAGRERSGFESSRENLFERATMLLAPPPKADLRLTGRLESLFHEIGFAAVRFTTPEEHDQMIAYTSQLAHVLSGAYVKNPLSASHRGFSAGSFQDLTRVARLNEDMWTELFLDNADYLIDGLDDLIFRLSEYRAALVNGDTESLRKVLREGRLKKEAIEP